MFSAIIVAAGGSRRMGFDKLSAKLAGKPVLAHTVQAFCQCEDVDEVVIVCSAGNETWVNDVVEDTPHRDKISAVVQGGSERHFSVWNGMETVSKNTDLIGVHDGARPLITPAAITSCASIAAHSGAATLARPISDTVKRCDENDCVSETVDRDRLWAMETPQVFHASLLRQAYEAILARGELVTDEVSAVQAFGHSVKVVASHTSNFKITYPADLELAERLLLNP